MPRGYSADASRGHDAEIRSRPARASGVLTQDGTLAPTTSAAPTAAPVSVAPLHYETDVLVVGAGLAGAAAAYAARQADPGAKITLLAASLSDVTTAYSGGWLWLPNNNITGDDDPKDDFVAHASAIAYDATERTPRASVPILLRTSRGPSWGRGDAAAATRIVRGHRHANAARVSKTRPKNGETRRYPAGAPAWAREGLEAFWDAAPIAMDDLRAAGVVDWDVQRDMLGRPFPDYYGGDAFPDNKLPRGRVVRATRDAAPLSGVELLDAIRTAAAPDLVLEGYLATEIDETVGATTVAATPKNLAKPGLTVSASRGVVLATGGAIRGANAYDVDATVKGSCASPDATGAALDAVAALPGVEIVNKGNVWQYETDAAGSAVWFLWYGQPGGDFVVVDRHGQRVYNEGLSYNRRAAARKRGTGRLDAAASTPIVRGAATPCDAGGESRRRRGCRVDRP